jgi:hypothetical protein
MVIEVFFVHSQGHLSWNFSAKIPDLTTSWCSIFRTGWTNAFVDYGGFPLLAAINWSSSFQCTPAVYYTVNWLPFTIVWIYSHWTACCFIIVLLSVLMMIFKCASRVISLVGAMTASWWTNWCLRSGCVTITDVLDKAPVNRPDLDPLGPGWGGCESMICCCGIWENDDNETKWEVLRII